MSDRGTPEELRAAFLFAELGGECLRQGLVSREEWESYGSVLKVAVNLARSTRPRKLIESFEEFHEFFRDRLKCARVAR